MAENEAANTVPDNGGISPKRFALGSGIFALGAIGIGFLHALWSRFDLTSVIVSMVALTPFLALVFKRMRFGYGDKSVDLEPHRIFAALQVRHSLEVKAAPVQVIETETVSGAVERAPVLPPFRMSMFGAEQVTTLPATSLLKAPDEVVFVRLRGELEKRLVGIAQAYGVSHVGIPTTQLMRRLQSRGVLSDSEARALFELIAAGNAQAHGAPVAPGIADFARIESDRLLQTLDNLATKPTQDLISRIARLAAQSGKMAIVEQPVRIAGKTYRPDIYLPNELLVEVKLRSSAPAVVMGLSQLKHYMETSSANGLLVLGDEPDNAARAYADLMKDEGVALSWLDDDTFIGGEKAHEIAPWLFPLKRIN